MKGLFSKDPKQELKVVMTCLIYILLGVFILFIGCVFKIGIRLKEEQKLAI